MYKMKQTGCYQRDGITYAEQFPERWARYHYPGTGPIQCEGCREYGFWNNAFVCYCIKCANIYEYERGGGVYGGIHLGEYGTHRQFVKTACNTYLKDVLLDEIGEKNVIDSVQEFGLEDEWTGIETLYYLTLKYHAAPIQIPIHTLPRVADVSNNQKPLHWKKLPNS